MRNSYYDLFLSPDDLGMGWLGYENGKRCVLGHILWEIWQVPHDRLLNKLQIARDNESGHLLCVADLKDNKWMTKDTLFDLACKVPVLSDKIGKLLYKDVALRARRKRLNIHFSQQDAPVGMAVHFFTLKKLLAKFGVNLIFASKLNITQISKNREFAYA